MTDDISKALRIAAGHMKFHHHFNVASDLNTEADRLDREAADDAGLDEAAELAAKAFYVNGVMFEKKWHNVARALRDHFRKPRTSDLDPEFIAGQISWWINANGGCIYAPIPATLLKRANFIDGLGRFVLDLVNGTDQ